MRGIGQLRVSEIDDFIEYFIDEYKVLADDFFVDEAAKVLDDDYDPVEQFQDVGGGDIEPCRCYNVDG